MDIEVRTEGSGAKNEGCVSIDHASPQILGFCSKCLENMDSYIVREQCKSSKIPSRFFQTPQSTELILKIIRSSMAIC